MSDSTTQGHCLCGKIQFEITGKLDSIGHCHCTMCQRWHGAPYGSYVRVVEPDGFKFTAGAELYKVYQSSADGRRGFCSNCGTSLSGEEDNQPRYINLMALENTNELKPQGHIFVGSKARWETIGDGLPQFEAFPPA